MKLLSGNDAILSSNVLLISRATTRRKRLDNILNIGVFFYITMRLYFSFVYNPNYLISKTFKTYFKVSLQKIYTCQNHKLYTVHMTSLTRGID